MASVFIDGGQSQNSPIALAVGKGRQSEVDLLDTLHLGSLMQAPALIALLRGPDHVYEFVNERYVQVIGDRNYSGRPVRDVVPEAVDQGLVAILDRVYATGEPFVATEMPLQFTQGTAGTLEEGFYNFVYQPLADGSGVVVGIMVHAVEVTEQVLARRRHERLAAERAQYQQELTTRVLQAQEDERKRIARDLHDETLQALTTLLITLDLAESRLPEGSDDAASALARVRSIAIRALDETRTLAHSLRPPILDDAGLVAALEALGEEYMQTFNVHILVEWGDGAESSTHLDPSIETVLFRVAQEAVTNACKHARGSEVRIGFTLDGGYGTLTVNDNGRGFDGHQAAVVGRHSGLGLDGMRERAALVGGKLRIDTASGKGTRVTLRVPVGGDQSRSPAEDADVGNRSAETSSTLNVLLVDDHAMVREGLKLILETQPGIRVAGEADDGRQALDLVERLRPDVVVMDIAMPNLNGFDATRQIKRRFPEVNVLILTSHENRQYVAQIVKTGADGCLLKRSAGTELVTALETVREGKRYVSPSVAGTLLDDYRVRIDHDGEDLLTEREREVVQLVAEGHTNQGIARKLGISVKTVETHRTHIMDKLGAADRTDLVKYAIRSGMISPE